MKSFTTLEALARVGFLVKGLLYMISGALAVQVAAKAGGRLTGTRGALSTVLGQPYGRTLLLGAAVGLLGYAAWRILQGILDADNHGSSWRGRAVRASFVLRGAAYGAVGLQAIRLHRGLRASSGSAEREVVAEALQWPLGDWLVVVAGLGLIGFALQQVYAAVTSRLERNLDLHDLRREAGEWAVTVSRFGVGARAVAFALLGWATVVAGWSRDPSEAGTMASSLRTMAEQPGDLGRLLLGVMAAGFIAYGFYEVIHARYLRIQRPSM